MRADGPTSVDDWADTLQHWDQAMRQALDTPLARIDRLPPRHKRLIRHYNATTGYLPSTQTLPSLLEPVLSQYSHCVAVHTTEARMSYGSYCALAWRLARGLRSLGVGRHDRVAVLMRRTAQMPPALYGVISAGAAYVPLETDLPAERLASLLESTGARIMVTDAGTLHSGALPLAGSALRHIVCVDPWPRTHSQGLPVMDRKALDALAPQAPPPINEAGDPCYVIYTSGSTGRPKGVVISHRALVNALIGLNNTFHISAGDRMLCFSSYAFDLSVWDIFGAALAGAMVVLPTREQTRDPLELWSLMHQIRPTVWDSAPTGMGQVVAAFNEGGIQPLDSMRLVVLGGEAMPRSLPGDLARAFPGSSLSNAGGATEGTIYSIYYHPVSCYEAHWKSIPYGRPLPNQRMHVLNDEMLPCAIGEKGMLWIGGLSVATGYLDDAARTAAAFVQAPWSGDQGERIYRTGDLGIMRADGLIELCGRADHQIKLRGHRIEPGEIDAVLEGIEGIEQCAVIVADRSRAPRLVACYVSRQADGDAQIQHQRLHQALASRLPDYMLPSQFIQLTDPPINASGKLDRKALAELVESGAPSPASLAAAAAPADAREAELAQSLARILHVEQVGVDEDFFLIGGDSLLTLQYLSALGRMGLSATPRDIQQGRSIRGVLSRVQQRGRDATAAQATTVALTPMGRKFFERLPLPDRHRWQQLMVLRFDHQPDIARLEHAMTRVHAHHPLLRANWDGQALQVPPAGPVHLELLDLGGAPRLWRERLFQRRIEQLRERARLDTPSLSAALLIQCGPDDVRLCWVLHHLIVDANCWRPLIDDLACTYRDPQTRLLHAGSVQDLVAAVERGIDPVLQVLRHQPPWERMPVPRRLGPPATGLEADNRTLRAVLTPAQTQRLYAALRGEANLNMVLLTALAMAIREWSSQRHVRFDVISNGRGVDASHDFSRSVGWFATHNPFGVQWDEGPAAALEAVGLAWTRYQRDMPLFVAACNEARRLDIQPLGSHADQALLYSFLGDFDSLALPEGWQILGSAGCNRGRANPRTHELEFEALVASGQLMLRLVYPRSQLRRSHAEALLRHFRQALDTLIQHQENT